MLLITKPQRELMTKNWLQDDNARILKPVIKLFTPDAQCTWLFTELNPANNDTLFGLCDLGLGMPEFGYASLREIASLRGRLGLPVERDRSFTATKPLSEYAEEAFQRQHIIA